MRLSKFLASKNIASRRKCDSYIEQNKIKVNSSVAKVGQKLIDGDKIFLDGNFLFTYQSQESYQTQVIAYSKPINVLCSKRDDKGRTLLQDHLELEKGQSWTSVGRLDYKTTGLILLTNNGDLAHRLMHPSSNIPREYWVKVKPKITHESLEKIKKGVMLKDGLARAKSCKLLENTISQSWVSLTLLDGRNREVRRIFEALGHDVMKLKRVKYGPINLGNLNLGEQRSLSASEIQKLESCITSPTGVVN